MGFVQECHITNNNKILKWLITDDVILNYLAKGVFVKTPHCKDIHHLTFSYYTP